MRTDHSSTACELALEHTPPPATHPPLQGDIVLLALREYQDSKADVIGKYSPDEARELKKRGELPATVRVNDIGGLDDAAADDKEDAGECQRARRSGRRGGMRH